MKKNNLYRKMAMVMAVGFLGFIYSCKNDEEKITVQDVADASSESITDSYYEDADDLSLNSLQDYIPGGRVATDPRICVTPTIVDGSTNITGSIILDFADGCTDPNGNVRKGKINLAYTNGPIGITGFTVVTTFDGYSINGIALEGTRTVTRVEASAQDNIKHHIVLADGKATWPDATFATRSSEFDREWSLIGGGTVSLDGEAGGIGRGGKEYTMNITNTLVYRVDCAVSDGIYMAVEGTKVFTINGRQITIDFGSGSCDRSVTVTINGVSREVTVGDN